MKRSIALIVVFLLALTTASAYALTEDDHYGTADELPVALKALLPTDYIFVDGMKVGENTYILMQDGSKGRRVFIYNMNDKIYSLVCESTLITQLDGVDIYISESGADTIDASYPGVWHATYKNLGNDMWEAQQITATDTIGFSKYLGMYSFNINNPYQLLFYPGSQTFNLEDHNPASLPHTWEDATKAQNPSGYAKVSITDPEKRLHLRAEPSADAQSLGRYYNGTPVHVHSTEGEWAMVSIANVDGYVHNDSLTYGEKMLTITSAFPRFSPTVVDFENGIQLYATPSDDATVVAEICNEDYEKKDVLVIGVANNDYYHVLCTDDTTGYIEAKHIK